MNSPDPAAGPFPLSAEEPAPKRFATIVDLQDTHDALLSHSEDADEKPEQAAGWWLEVAQFVRRAEATGALLDLPRDRRVAQSILDYWASALYRAGQPVPSARLAAFDETLAPQLKDEPCPYQGLAAFHGERSEFFHGRGGLIREALGRISVGERLLVFVGDSGSGKSSLVLAGLVPGLQRGGAPEFKGCRVIILVPGSQPLDNLAQVVRGFLPSPSVTPALADRLVVARGAFQRDPDALTELLRDTGESPVVLVVDQFEELFTLCQDEATRRAFADQLLAAADATVPKCVLLLTMRTDFVDLLVRLPQLHERFKRARVDVSALDINELRAAIEMPASQVGLRFEPGIVDDLISTILGERAGLPLLQFTLLKLWRGRRRNRITLPVYQAVGNPREALARSANDFYNNKLIPENRLAVRRILLRLVRPGEGQEFTSNRILRSEIFRDAESRPRVEESLRRLVDEGLVKETKGPTPADTQIEVAHEALVRNWPLLAGWLEEERVALRKRRVLTDRAQAWEEHQREASYLLRGKELDDASGAEDLTPLERQLVDASLAARDAERHADEERRERELREQLEAESRERELERAKGQARKRGILAATFFIIMALAIAATFWAVKSQSEAKQSRKAASEKEREATNNLGRALIAEQGLSNELAEVLGLSSNRNVMNSNLTVQAKALTEATNRLSVANLSLREATNTLDAARAEAVKQETQAKAARDQAKESERQRTAELFESQLTRASLLAQGEEYAAARTALAQSKEVEAKVPRHELDSVIRPERRSTRNLLDWFVGLMRSGTTRTNAEAQGAPLRAMATSSDGSLLATVGEQGKAMIFDLIQNYSTNLLSRQDETVTCVALDPSGRGLVTAAANDRRVLCWPLSAPSFTNQWRAPGQVAALAVSHNGKIVVVGGLEYAVQATLLDRMDAFTALPNGPTNVTCLAFSPEDRLLACTAFDGTLCLWTSDPPDARGLRRVKPPRPLPKYPGLLSVAFNPRGREMATSSADGGIQLWDLGSGTLKSVLRGHRNKVSSLAYATNGEHLVSASWDQSLRIWSLTNRSAIKVLQGHAAAVTGVAVAGDRIFSCSVDGTWRMWQLSVDPEQLPIFVPAQRPTCCALSPDARLVAVGSEGGEVQCWSLVNHTNTWRTNAHPDKSVTRLAFSPDGSRLASVGFDRALKVWDVSTGTNLFQSSAALGEINDVVFSSNGTNLVTAGSGGKSTLRAPSSLVQTNEAGQIGLFELAQPWPRPRLQRAPGGEVLCVAFDNRGEQLLSADADGTTWIWNLQTIPPTPAKLLSAEGDLATCTAFSPDGRLIATGYRSGTLEIATNSPFSYKLAARLAGHEEAIVRLAFSPDGGQVLTASADRTLRAWDLNLQAPRQLFVLRLPVAEEARTPLWDFAFLGKDTVRGEAWIALPLLTRGEVMIYRLGPVYR